MSKAGNLPFLWTLLPQKPKIGQIGQRATTSTAFTFIILLASKYMIACRVDVGSACVDIRQSPKTDTNSNRTEYWRWYIIIVTVLWSRVVLMVAIYWAKYEEDQTSDKTRRHPARYDTHRSWTERERDGFTESAGMQKSIYFLICGRLLI